MRFQSSSSSPLTPTGEPEVGEVDQSEGPESTPHSLLRIIMRAAKRILLKPFRGLKERRSVDYEPSLMSVENLGILETDDVVNITRLSENRKSEMVSIRRKSFWGEKPSELVDELKDFRWLGTWITTGGVDRQKSVFRRVASRRSRRLRHPEDKRREQSRYIPDRDGEGLTTVVDY